jgi:hypothetical protein
LKLNHKVLALIKASSMNFKNINSIKLISETENAYVFKSENNIHNGIIIKVGKEKSSVRNSNIEDLIYET